MEKYERKLQEFRIQEKQKHRIDKLKCILWKPILILSSFQSEELPAVKPEPEPKCTINPANIKSELSKLLEKSDEEVSVEESYNWKKFIFYVILWCGLFRYAVYVEFGAIFVIFSGFYIIWANTRTTPRKANELSAYSVFNPNCERIEGTFDAEQIDKQIRSGMMF